MLMFRCSDWWRFGGQTTLNFAPIASSARGACAAVYRRRAVARQLRFLKSYQVTRKQTRPRSRSDRPRYHPRLGPITLTFNLPRNTVMIHSRTTRTSRSKVSCSENRVNRRTFGRTRPIALSSPLMQSATMHENSKCD